MNAYTFEKVQILISENSTKQEIKTVNSRNARCFGMYKTIILPAVSVSATLGLSHVNMKISFGHLGMDGILCMEYSFVKNTLFTLDRVNIGEGYIN